MECTFGILKGRFSILRYDLRINSIDMCDKIWLTYCALHNRLLFIDELHENWESGLSSLREEIYQRTNEYSYHTIAFVEYYSNRNGNVNSVNHSEQTINDYDVDLRNASFKKIY